jgi:hypothetical protein
MITIEWNRIIAEIEMGIGIVVYGAHACCTKGEAHKTPVFVAVIADDSIPDDMNNPSSWSSSCSASYHNSNIGLSFLIECSLILQPLSIPRNTRDLLAVIICEFISNCSI